MEYNKWNEDYIEAHYAIAADIQTKPSGACISYRLRFRVTISKLIGYRPFNQLTEREKKAVTTYGNWLKNGKTIYPQSGTLGTPLVVNPDSPLTENPQLQEVVITATMHWWVDCPAGNKKDANGKTINDGSYYDDFDVQYKYAQLDPKNNRSPVQRTSRIETWGQVGGYDWKFFNKKESKIHDAPK